MLPGSDELDALNDDNESISISLTVNMKGVQETDISWENIRGNNHHLIIELNIQRNLLRKKLLWESYLNINGVCTCQGYEKEELSSI